MLHLTSRFPHLSTTPLPTLCSIRHGEPHRHSVPNLERLWMSDDPNWLTKPHHDSLSARWADAKHEYAGCNDNITRTSPNSPLRTTFRPSPERRVFSSISSLSYQWPALRELLQLLALCKVRCNLDLWCNWRRSWPRQLLTFSSLLHCLHAFGRTPASTRMLIVSMPRPIPMQRSGL